MNTKHKYYEVIVAWAEGKQVQFKIKPKGRWIDWITDMIPSFNEGFEYRIKPSEPVVRWKWATQGDHHWWHEHIFFMTDEEAEKVTGPKIKLEYTRTEFPAEGSE